MRPKIIWRTIFIDVRLRFFMMRAISMEASMKFATVLMAASLFGGCVADGTDVQSSDQQDQQTETLTKHVHHVRTDAHSAGGRHTKGNGISYHGGPLMLGTPNIHYIWYGN